MSPSLIAGVHLVILLLGYSFAGWLLAAFAVPWLIWLGTLVITLHLIRSGTAAIVLSSGWIVLIMGIAAVVKAWTVAWDSRVPFQQAQLWAQSLLLIWFGAIVLMVLLALADSTANQLGISRRWFVYSLTALIWSALGIGSFLYHHFS